ncbi:hypothetical protein C7Y66_29370 [Chroococcidiopsis sp. CCALA 051]|nr:hypothetical protein C7Y66_29370 [Chroococcidiopsis sp. CCALA 051]
MIAFRSHLSFVMCHEWNDREGVRSQEPEVRMNNVRLLLTLRDRKPPNLNALEEQNSESLLKPQTLARAGLLLTPDFWLLS